MMGSEHKTEVDKQGCTTWQRQGEERPCPVTGWGFWRAVVLIGWMRTRSRGTLTWHLWPSFLPRAQKSFPLVCIAWGKLTGKGYNGPQGTKLMACPKLCPELKLSAIRSLLGHEFSSFSEGALRFSVRCSPASIICMGRISGGRFLSSFQWPLRLIIIFACDYSVIV